MPAYFRQTLSQFATTEPTSILGLLQQAYASDGFASQYTRQTRVWADLIPNLQCAFSRLLLARPEACEWHVLLEYPLHRLRRRIDVVVLARDLIVVIECKSRADIFAAEARRQVEEYALDLRDFHAESRQRTIIPVLWKTEPGSPVGQVLQGPIDLRPGTVTEAVKVDSGSLSRFLTSLPTSDSNSIDATIWDQSPYRPVPNVIEAATSIFAGHDVREIANADADNLQVAAKCLIELIREAHESQKRYLLFLTGVPGSGKTLAGLHVVHSSVATGRERQGDIVYLSGNTPLVVVLREALARDERRRRLLSGMPARIGDIRRDVRARIQHINDFLQESLRGSPSLPPHEHVIVFDEAQRAWDEKHGAEKFERTASEPTLLLQLMSRHRDWCACVCLVGGGQEINSGEEGVLGWGDALRKMEAADRKAWTVIGPGDIFGSDNSGATLGDLPPDLLTRVENALHLNVPQRSYRSPSLCRWVDHVLAGDAIAAKKAAQDLQEYPLFITRSLTMAKLWLRRQGRGERRYGLVASSGARRLRADGLGVTLNATAGMEIAQWYLNEPGDIRSSFALEVPANEYTCQGLELDFVCLSWGGDFLWNSNTENWTFWRLSGSDWQSVQQSTGRRFITNSYRVLLTRARQGVVLWIPQGDDLDRTRQPGPLNDTAAFLDRCGAKSLDRF